MKVIQICFSYSMLCRDGLSLHLVDKRHLLVYLGASLGNGELWDWESHNKSCAQGACRANTPPTPLGQLPTAIATVFHKHKNCVRQMGNTNQRRPPWGRLLHRVCSVRTIRGQTPVKHPKKHPPKKAIQFQKTCFHSLEDSR